MCVCGGCQVLCKVSIQNSDSCPHPRRRRIRFHEALARSRPGRAQSASLWTRPSTRRHGGGTCVTRSENRRMRVKGMDDGRTTSGARGVQPCIHSIIYQTRNPRLTNKCSHPWLKSRSWTWSSRQRAKDCKRWCRSGWGRRERLRGRFKRC